MSKPMKAAELAARLGHSIDWLHRHVDRLVVEEMMPTPLCRIGQKRWDRARIETWLAGHRLRQAANDPAPVAAPGSDADWRELLAKHYGQAAGGELRGPLSFRLEQLVSIRGGKP